MDLNSNFYNKLSDQGKKRVDSYAKFIYDEETSAENYKTISQLVTDLKPKGKKT